MKYFSLSAVSIIFFSCSNSGNNPNNGDKEIYILSDMLSYENPDCTGIETMTSGLCSASSTEDIMSSMMCALINLSGDSNTIEMSTLWILIFLQVEAWFVLLSMNELCCIEEKK